MIGAWVWLFRDRFFLVKHYLYPPGSAQLQKPGVLCRSELDRCQLCGWIGAGWTTSAWAFAAFHFTILHEKTRMPGTASWMLSM